MRVWDYAYRAYRKGDYWQQFARDHERFKKRTQNLEKILNPILLTEHRDKIYYERFKSRDDKIIKGISPKSKLFCSDKSTKNVLQVFQQST